jgi:hypothetical protein
MRMTNIEGGGSLAVSDARTINPSHISAGDHVLNGPVYTTVNIAPGPARIPLGESATQRVNEISQNGGGQFIVGFYGVGSHFDMESRELALSADLDMLSVTHVSPSSGPTSGGTEVTLSGAGFTGATAVTFGSTPASGFNVDSATRITATVPAGTGTVDVRVTTPDGVSPTFAAARFTYLSSNAALAGLSLSAGSLSPDFAPGATGYAASVAHETSSVTVTPTAADAGASVTVNGSTVVSGSASTAIALDVGPNIVTTVVTAEDGTTTRAYTMTVNRAGPPLSLNPAPVPDAKVGRAYSAAITAAGGVAPYSYAVTAGDLPAGLTLGPDGVVSGTPTAGGMFNFTVMAMDSSAEAGGSDTVSRAYALVVALPTLVPGALTLPSGQTAVAYSHRLTGSGGTAPYTFALMPGYQLPSGLTLSPEGVIEGAPTVAGNFRILMSMTDSSTGTGPFKIDRFYQIDIVAPRPTVTSISPSAGMGGPVVITGTGFTAAPSTNAVSLGPVAGFAYVVDSDTQITLMVPSNGVGIQLDVRVTTPGGRSVSSPAALYTWMNKPVAEAVSATVAFGSSDNPITPDLSAGPLDSVAVETAPAHGTATVSGLGLTYTPAAGFHGTDSFTYTATNRAGTSAPATVTMTVALPPAPTVLEGMFGAAYNAPTQIEVGDWISGVHTSLTIASAPTHGTATVAGDVITYAPEAGFFGTDSFTWTATGPGGTSAPATLTVMVATPNAPTVAAASVAATYNASTQIDLSSSISGVHTSLTVVSEPADGTTTVTDDVITYTPTTGYFGVDSFTYTATGPGGTSAPATVTVTVATPGAPVVAAVSVAAAYDAPTAIDLSGSITGVHTNLAVGSAPAHGTTSVSGDVVTYTPAAGYFGADSFTYTATGPGGTSAPATVTVTVATPAPPTVAAASAAVAYDSTGQAIPLTASGVYTTLAVATAPAHGTATISGTTATYVPAAGYFGADSFTYTATGPGGTSAMATVTVMVATPAPPVIDEPTGPIVAPPSTDGSTSVDLGAVSQGAVDGYRITVVSQFGVAEIIDGASAARAQSTGSVGARAAPAYRLVYTPLANFMGEDAVTVVAYGPGGDSAPVTFTFQAAGKAPDLSGEMTSDGSMSFAPTAGLVGGPFQGLRITRAPAFGAATVNGLSIVFTPGNGGATSLDYVIDLAFGASAPGRIDLTANALPGVEALVARTLQGVPVTVRISDVAGGPFTGAAVVSMAPATAGTATIAKVGADYDLTFVSTGDFSGETVVSYSLTNAFGTTSSTLTVMVEARPDPSLDPEVRAVATGQVISARRFADAQINNFQQRLRDLRDGTNGWSNGLSLNLGMGRSDEDRDPQQALRRQLGQDRNLDPGALGGDRDREMLGLDIWAGRASAAPTVGASDDRLNAGAQPAAGAASSVGLWTSGSVDWGRQDATGQRDSRFTTQGATLGLDVKVSDQLIVGAGVGYGEDKTRIGDNGSVTNGKAFTGAFYASWRPAEAFYVDGVLGYASLDFTSRRWVEGLAGQADGYADGERSGDVRFFSAAFGRVLRGERVTSDFYARLDARDITLDGFTETGGGLSALNWDEIEQRSLSANLGASWRWILDSRRYGRFVPTARVEWSHELEDIGAQGVRYADWASSPTYLVPLNAWSRNAINLDLGGEWSLSDRLMLSLGYRGALGDASTSHGAQIGMKYGW